MPVLRSLPEDVSPWGYSAIPAKWSHKAPAYFLAGRNRHRAGAEATPLPGDLPRAPARSAFGVAPGRTTAAVGDACHLGGSTEY
jgi:hypothetical protein